MPIAYIAACLLCREKRLLYAVGRCREHLFGAQLRNSNARCETQRIRALVKWVSCNCLRTFSASGNAS